MIDLKLDLLSGVVDAHILVDVVRIRSGRQGMQVDGVVGPIEILDVNGRAAAVGVRDDEHVPACAALEGLVVARRGHQD